MTLDTRVYVVDEVPRYEVFRRCQEILQQYDEHRRGPDQQQHEDSDWGDHRVLMNAGMQGLPGWLILHYRPEGAYRTEAQAAEHDDCDDDCDGSRHAPACWIEVSIDTAYGYRGPGDISCSQLHVKIITELGMWLDSLTPSWCDVHDALEGHPDPVGHARHGVPCAASPTRNPRQGVRWLWLNEYSGQVHQGYDMLPGLIGAGDQADAWFQREVKPAIAAHVVATMPKGDL